MPAFSARSTWSGPRHGGNLVRTPQFIWVGIYPPHNVILDSSLEAVNKALLFVLAAWTEEELDTIKLPEEWYKHSAAIVPAHGQDKILLMFVAGEGARYKES